MVDNEKWWKAPPELAPMVEQNRSAFKAQFGCSFEDALIKRYWLGTSDDGAYLAFQIHKPDGTVQRFTMCREWVSDFVIQLAGAIDDMNERALAAGLAKAEPKGKA